MKIKKFFSLLAFSSCLIGSNLSAGTISKNKSFSSIVTTSTMSTSLHILVFDKNSDVVENTIGKINTILQKSKISKGGQYSIVPEHQWKNGKNSFLRYVANISYEFSFSDKKEYEDILNQIKSIEKIELTQSPIQLSISDETMTSTTERLELEAIEYGKAYTSKLSNWFGDGNCKIKNITFSSNNFSHMPLTLMRSATLDASMPNSEVSPPLENEKKIQLDASYIFECDTNANQSYHKGN